MYFQDNTSHPKTFAWRVCQECDLRFQFQKTQYYRIFCDQCSQRKCRKCMIVLSYKYECEICGSKHGLPSKFEPSYCIECAELFPTTAGFIPMAQSAIGYHASG